MRVIMAAGKFHGVMAAVTPVLAFEEDVYGEAALPRFEAPETVPERDVVMEQRHRPGEAMQTDFTWGNSLKITIAGDRFDHLLLPAA